jgi:predicted aspartyl protease
VNRRLVSQRFPYFPIRVDLGRHVGDFEALLDTGFDGEVVIPESFAHGLGRPDQFRRFLLADGSESYGRVYRGTVTIGPFDSFPVEMVALGDECLVGARLASRFLITLDHGQRVIIEP